MAPAIENLREDFNKIEEKLKGLQLPIAFSHNDVWVNNYVYKRKTGTVIIGIILCNLTFVTSQMLKVTKYTLRVVFHFIPDSMQLIDFEYAGFNYDGYDLGGFFSNFPIQRIVG